MFSVKNDGIECDNPIWITACFGHVRIRPGADQHYRAGSLPFVEHFCKRIFKTAVLFGLAVGYVLAICLGRVDLSVIMSGGLISLPKILLSGVQMIAQAGFTQRNITIASLALAFGIGFTSASEAGIWGIFSEIIQTVFGANVVAVVFVVAVFLNLVLPKNMDVKKKDISE